MNPQTKKQYDPRTVEYYADRNNPDEYSASYHYDAEADTLRSTYTPKFFGKAETDETPNFSRVYWEWFLCHDNAQHADPTEATQSELYNAWYYGTALGYF